MKQKRVSYDLIKLAWPIIFGHLGHILIGAGDVFVAGRHSATMLAAAGIANSLFVVVFGIGVGLLLGISAVLSKERGAGNDSNKYLWLSLIYAFVVSLFCIICVWLANYLVPIIGIEDKLVPMVQDYLRLRSFSLIGLLIYFAIKEFLQSHEDVFFINLIAVLAIFVNVFFNFVFVFGLYDFPKMGMQGLALSSLLIRTIMAIVALVYAHKYLRWGFVYSKRLLKEIFAIGWPMAWSLSVEIAGFCMVTFLVGRISTVQTAASNIVFTISSITFMVPLAIANAATVKIGHAFGAKNKIAVLKNAKAAIRLSAGFMLMTGVSFFLFPQFFVQLFTFDSQVIVIATTLILMAAVFQLFDGLQITIGGILRGIQVSKPIFYVQFLVYWLIGIPFGSYLAFYKGFEVYGLWIGLVLALALAAISLSFILFYYKHRNFLNKI